MFKLITLCSGIGSPELATERVYGKGEVSLECACEIDKFARQTFLANFEPKEFPEDVTTLDGKKYNGDIDALIGGFPCQPFSTNGYLKGFEDTRGTIFFHFARLLDEVQPKYFIFENVTGLLSHDKPKLKKQRVAVNLFGEDTFETVATFNTVNMSTKNKGVEIGKTMATIEKTLNDSGYHWGWKVLDSLDFNVPQSRKRVFMVGFKNKEDWDRFKFPTPIKRDKVLNDCLEPNPSDNLWLTEEQLDARKNSTFTTTRTSLQYKDYCDTLSARDYKDPKVVMYGENRGRRLTPREYLNLQDFPKEFKQVVSSSQMYKQAGNSITVAVAERLIESCKNALDKKEIKIGGLFYG